MKTRKDWLRGAELLRIAKGLTVPMGGGFGFITPPASLRAIRARNTRGYQAADFVFRSNE